MPNTLFGELEQLFATLPQHEQGRHDDSPGGPGPIIYGYASDGMVVVMSLDRHDDPRYDVFHLDFPIAPDAVVYRDPSAHGKTTAVENKTEAEVRDWLLAWRRRLRV